MADLQYGYGPDEADGSFVQFTHHGAPQGAQVQAGPGRVSRTVQTAGALVSVALILGLGWWGWQLLVRDVSGVPVVRALDGPMRVSPVDPGGRLAAHQGLAVNRISAQGEAAPPADRVVLAPRSVDLLPEDVPGAALHPAAALIPAPEPKLSAGRSASTLAPEPAVLSIDPDHPGAPPDIALLEAAIADATALALSPIASAQASILPDVIPANVPGVARSLRPRPRPEGDPALLLAMASANAAIESGPAGAEVDSATLAPGTRLVQFGAYPSADEARAAWDGLFGRFGTLMDGKGRVIEEANAGGSTFFRLRAAGFTDLADARRFCAAIIPEGADCIPVVTR